MTFETLTVIELLLSVSNYPEDKCDKIRDELSTMDKKAKAFDEIKKLRNSYYTYSKRDSGGLIALLDAKPFGREVSHLINKKEYTEDK